MTSSPESTTLPEATVRPISENLDVLRGWMRSHDTPATVRMDQAIMRNVKMAVVCGGPALLIGFLAWVISSAAGSRSETYCACPDGGVRSTISKRRLAD